MAYIVLSTGNLLCDLGQLLVNVTSLLLVLITCSIMLDGSLDAAHLLSTGAGTHLCMRREHPSWQCPKPQ